MLRHANKPGLWQIAPGWASPPRPLDPSVARVGRQVGQHVLLTGPRDAGNGRSSLAPLVRLVVQVLQHVLLRLKFAARAPRPRTERRSETGVQVGRSGQLGAAAASGGERGEWGRRRGKGVRANEHSSCSSSKRRCLCARAGGPEALHGARACSPADKGRSMVLVRESLRFEADER